MKKIKSGGKKIASANKSGVRACAHERETDPPDEVKPFLNNQVHNLPTISGSNDMQTGPFKLMQ